MSIAVFLLVLTVGVSPGGFERSPYSSPGSDPGWLIKGDLIQRQHGSALYADTLVLIGSYTTPGKARDVWVQYPLAYLASDYLGVEVLDISDPANPTLLNTIDTPGQAFDIQVRDTLMYVADDYSGFQILNGTAIIAEYDTPRITRGIFVEDTVVYVADYDSLRVFSASDPTNPVEIGRLRTLSDERQIERVFVDGNYAYVADDLVMRIVDVSDPAFPVLVGEYSDPLYWFMPQNIYVSDSLAYVANYWNELFIIDVSDTANPFRLSFIGPIESWGFAWDVKVSGSYAYVANYDGGLWVVDVSDPANPQTAAIYNTPHLACGVFVDSFYIYVADYYSLLIFERTPKGVAESDFRREGTHLRLVQNAPNPFEHLTTIGYEVPRQRRVSLRIYDLAGRLVKELVDKRTEAGVYSVFWDGKNQQGQHVPSGLYFCRLEAGSQSESRKMTLLR